jgi:hypothetical protein
LQLLAEEWAVISATGPADGSVDRPVWLRQRHIWLRARIAEARVEQETLLSSPLGRLLAEFGTNQALEVLTSRLWEQISVKERELSALNAATGSVGSASGW